MAKSERQRGLIRQWRLVRALESARMGLSWRQLMAAGEDCVHVRTIRRDIDTLTCAGFPIDVESNVGGESTRVILRQRGACQ